MRLSNRAKFFNRKKLRYISLYRYGKNYKMVFNKNDTVIQDIEVDDDAEVDRERSMYNSLMRTRRVIKEYVLCNEFDYFVTLTIDKKKYDRYDLKEYISKLGQFIRDKRRYMYDTSYLLIPENHSDGAIHLHGLMMFKSEKENEPQIKMINDNLNWLDYYNKFGYSKLHKINKSVKDYQRIANYVSKYITKEMIVNYNSKRYYVTRDLQKRETIFKDHSIYNYEDYIEKDYETEYTIVYNVKEENVQEMLKIYRKRRLENVI